MNLVDKLLQGVSEQDIKDYQSYAQLHLKQILTTINKHKLQDTTTVQVRKYQCYVDCYGYFKQAGAVAEVSEKLQQLRLCKQKCGRQLTDVQKFLDNINFYSQLKFQGCSKKCKGGTQQQNNICLWECYNRLDRRYKQYWANQKTNIQAKHTI